MLKFVACYQKVSLETSRYDNYIIFLSYRTSSIAGQWVSDLYLSPKVAIWMTILCTQSQSLFAHALQFWYPVFLQKWKFFLGPNISRFHIFFGDPVFINIFYFHPFTLLNLAASHRGCMSCRREYKISLCSCYWLKSLVNNRSGALCG